MNLARGFQIGLLVGVVVGAALLLLRPARLLAARVTAVAGDNPPIASVALVYGHGVQPASVILDIVGASGHVGSVTISGGRLFAQVPISGAAGETYRTRATTMYRVLGRLRVRTHEFPA
jgi:hypothetical protein